MYQSELIQGIELPYEYVVGEVVKIQTKAGHFKHSSFGHLCENVWGFWRNISPIFMLIRKMGGCGSCHGNVAMYIRKQTKHRIKIRRGGKWSAKVERCNWLRHLGTKSIEMGVEHGGHGGDMGGEGGRGVEVETSTHTTHSYPKAPQHLGYWTSAAPKTLQLHYLENF